MKHGHTASGITSPEYRAWCRAKDRCYNPRNIGFKNYGGRGIIMCDEWKHDFSAFLRDLGPRPNGFTLGRIDSNGPYSPTNCRWESWNDQGNNTSRNHHVVVNGQTMTIGELAKFLGINYSTLHYRFVRGWSVDQAIRGYRYYRDGRRCDPSHC